MERLSDVDDSWLQPVPRTFAPGEQFRVHHLVPATFASYLKILHPLYRAEATEGDDTVADAPSMPEHLNLEAILQLAARIDPEAEVFVRAMAGPDPAGERLWWREIAVRLGVPYGPSITDLQFHRDLPDAEMNEGTLDVLTTRAMVETLAAATIGPVFYRFFPIPWLYGGDTFTGDLEEVLRFFDPAELNLAQEGEWPPEPMTPQWWWPADRSWLVRTDYDSIFTVVCGTDELIARAAAHPDIESFVVGVDDLLP
jgi:hypothetical protein